MNRHNTMVTSMGSGLGMPPLLPLSLPGPWRCPLSRSNKGSLEGKNARTYHVRSLKEASEPKHETSLRLVYDLWSHGL